MDWATHVYGERIDGGEKGCLSHGRNDPDDERERKEGIGLVYPLQEPEADVADARYQGAQKEKISRPDALYVLPEDGRKHYSCKEDAAINLKVHLESALKQNCKYFGGTLLLF